MDVAGRYRERFLSCRKYGGASDRNARRWRRSPWPCLRRKPDSLAPVESTGRRLGVSRVMGLRHQCRLAGEKRAAICVARASAACSAPGGRAARNPQQRRRPRGRPQCPSATASQQMQGGCSRAAESPANSQILVNAEVHDHRSDDRAARSLAMNARIGDVQHPQHDTEAERDHDRGRYEVRGRGADDAILVCQGNERAELHDHVQS